MADAWTLGMPQAAGAERERREKAERALGLMQEAKEDMQRGLVAEIAAKCQELATAKAELQSLQLLRAPGLKDGGASNSTSKILPWPKGCLPLDKAAVQCHTM